MLFAGPLRSFFPAKTQAGYHAVQSQYCPLLAGYVPGLYPGKRAEHFTTNNLDPGKHHAHVFERTYLCNCSVERGGEVLPAEIAVIADFRFLTWFSSIRGLNHRQGDLFRWISSWKGDRDWRL